MLRSKKRQQNKHPLRKGKPPNVQHTQNIHQQKMYETKEFKKHQILDETRNTTNERTGNNPKPTALTLPNKRTHTYTGMVETAIQH